MKDTTKIAEAIVELLQQSMGTLVALSADGRKCEFRITTDIKDIAAVIEEGIDDSTRNAEENS